MSNSIDKANDEYNDIIAEWEQLLIVYKGKKAVQDAGEQYGFLPRDETMSDSQYEAYKTRASIPNLVKIAINNFLGIIQQEETEILLPEIMMPLIEEATKNGESLQALALQINYWQFLLGRCFVLADFDNAQALTTEEGRINSINSSGLPRFLIYPGTNVINWGTNVYGDFIILTEPYIKTFPDDPYRQERSTRYRVLQIRNDIRGTNGEFGVYTWAVFDKNEKFDIDRFIPATHLEQTIDQIPGVMFNSTNNRWDIEEPPLLELKDKAIEAYQILADYNRNLHLQGKHILVVAGGSQAGRSAQNPTPPPVSEQQRRREIQDEFDFGRKREVLKTQQGLNVPLGGDAKWIAPTEGGLKGQQQALQDILEFSAQFTGEYITRREGRVETAEAARLRADAETSFLTLNNVTVDIGMTKLLKLIAYWVIKGEDSTKERLIEGDDTEENPGIVFSTPKEFFIQSLDHDDIVKGREAGFPISDQMYVDMLHKRRVTPYNLQEIYDQLANEAAFKTSRGIIPEETPEEDENNNENEEENNT